MAKSLEEKLIDFIPSRKKYIFHLYGKSDTRKSHAVREILKTIFPIPDERKIIWNVTGYDQTNMVIEHLEHILTGDFPLRASYPDLQSCSNLRNIHILTQGLINFDEQMKQDKPYVLVIDNAENIFSLHLSLERKNWRKELVEQWRIFLRNLVELNGKGFYLKIVLITNAHILDLEELDDFLEYCEKIDEGFDPQKNKTTQQLIEELQAVVKIEEEERCSEEIVRPAFAIINRFLALDDRQKGKYADELRKILFKYIHVGSREYINIGDIVYQYRDGIKLIDALNEIGGGAAEGYIVEYIRQQVKKVLVFAEKIRNASADEPVALADIHKWNVKIIKRVYAVYHLADLFKKNAADCEENERLIGFLDCALKVLLHLPVRKKFADVGDILRTYGYSSLLLEMIDNTEGNIFPSDGAEDYLTGFSPVFAELFKSRGCIQTRIDILKGNIGFYNYPEDYVYAIDNYCRALDNEKDCSKEYPFLAAYEIINVLFQLVERKWESFLSREQKEKIILRLKQIAPGETCRDLFKTAGVLIRELEKRAEEIDSIPASGNTRAGIEAILGELESGYFSNNGQDAFFERMITAKIKYHKLETKLSIAKLSKENQAGRMNLSAETVGRDIDRLYKVANSFTCEPYWKFSIIYHLTKRLYFLAAAALTSGAKERIDAGKLIEINENNLRRSCSYGESLWREAKTKELSGDITRLSAEQARNDKERMMYSKKRIDLYNEARKIYLTLNCGYQLEGILDKIEQAEASLEA